ncbi:MAG: succinate-semialdehyde dehydrogenase [Planctomycetota bacterium]|nr:MAG: succinate-semialdehyde dehydrogenase [Planctomycetota bacterium]
MTQVSVNPATGRELERYESHSDEQAAQIVKAVAKAQREWKRSEHRERGAGLQRLADALRARSDELAQLMAREMGKPVSDGRSEVEKCAWVCEHYAEFGPSILADERLPSEPDGPDAFSVYQPLGVVLAVMPWNFPLWQVFRFLAPALAAGNAGVLKHASNVPGCALAIEELVRDAKFPGDVFRTLLIGSKQVDAVLSLPEVRAVTLTGSTPAGRAVAKRAGELLKPQVLELGGSDPYVILDDADLEQAVAACVTSRLINNGQSCVAAKRFVVVESVREEFEKRFVDAMSARAFGDPLHDTTTLGCMARVDLRDELHEQVRASVEAGARLALGGEVPAGDGAFYPPTVLADVAPGMPAYDDELFGPVAAIITARDADDAIRIANDSPFGLGAAVFTRDRELGRRLAAEHLDAGCCFVNGFVKSDPRWPFGGIKDSGYGRELGLWGPREFMNAKTVVVN